MWVVRASAGGPLLHDHRGREPRASTSGGRRSRRSACASSGATDRKWRSIGRACSAVRVGRRDQGDRLDLGRAGPRRRAGRGRWSSRPGTGRWSSGGCRSGGGSGRAARPARPSSGSASRKTIACGRPTAPPTDQPVSVLPSRRLRGGLARLLEVGRGVADRDRPGGRAVGPRRARPRPRSAGSCRPRTAGPGPARRRAGSRAGRTSSRIAVIARPVDRDLDPVDVVVRLVARGQDRAVVEDGHRRVLGRLDRRRGDRSSTGSASGPTPTPPAGRRAGPRRSLGRAGRPGSRPAEIRNRPRVCCPP